jgi:hypothetical protein
MLQEVSRKKSHFIQDVKSLSLLFFLALSALFISISFSFPRILFSFSHQRWSFFPIMKLMYTWARPLSLLLFSLLAIPADALPKRKSPSGKASSGATTGAATGATTGGATGAGGITTATDGSTILDKTVTIKYSYPPSSPHFQKALY